MSSPRRPYAYPRGPISQRQERCLQKHTHFLVGDMVAKAIVAELMRRFVLNKDDAQYILRADDDSKDPQREQNKRLIETVCKRSSEGFDAFVDALRVTGHDKAYRRLRSSLDGVADDMQLVLHGEGLEPRCHSERIDRLAKPKGVFYAGDLRRDRHDGYYFGGELQRRRMDAYHLDGFDGDLQLKRTIRQQQMEIDRLKDDLNEACEEIHRLKKVVKDQEVALIEQRDISNHKAEQLEQADAKITRLLEQVKVLEDDNDGLTKDAKTKQHRVKALEARVADLEVKLAHQQEHNDFKSNRISHVVKRLKDDAEELLRVSGPKPASEDGDVSREDTDTF